MTTDPTTLLLFSGGLDALVCAGMLLENEPRSRVVCVFYDYGQHALDAEWRATGRLVEVLQDRFSRERVTLQEYRLQDFEALVSGTNLVTGDVQTADAPVASYQVPGRNIMFLLHASILATMRGATEVAYGPHTWCHTGDSTPRFVLTMEQALRFGLGTLDNASPLRLRAPLLTWGKDDVVRMGARLALPLALAWSCYKGGRVHCGLCHSCVERRDAFRMAGVPDETVYLSNGASLSTTTTP